MSRYHHNKVSHDLEPVSGFGSRVATSVDGKTLTVHSSILNIDGYNYGQGDIGAYVEMIAPIETGLVATKDYDIGDSFVYGAQLYVVTSPIDEDEEIVIGENCRLSDSVSEIVTSADLKADAVTDQLTVDNTKFYFDSHDGKYGYNTSAARGADTFVPFNNVDWNNPVLGRLTTSTSQSVTVNLGFKPKVVVVAGWCGPSSYNALTMIAIGDYSYQCSSSSSYPSASTDFEKIAMPHTTGNRIGAITDTGFVVNSTSTSTTVRYLALR